MNNSTLQKIRDYDRSRPGFAGEHWLVLGSGVAVWLATRWSPSFAVRLAGSIAGTLLVARAANGRYGLTKRMRHTTLGKYIVD